MPNTLSGVACLVLAAMFIVATAVQAFARPRDPISQFVRGVERAFTPNRVVTHKKKVVTRQSGKTAEISHTAPRVVTPNQNVVTGQTGEASWYGPGFHGRKTASGVTYDMEAPMCAHRKLRFGTEVRITNLANGRMARCVIRDRGPFVADRVIDVSHLVANQLGMIHSGVARVSIAVME